MLLEVLESPEVRERGGKLLARRHQDRRHLDRLLHRGLDLVEPEEVGGLLREVDDVVDLGGERVDVLAVDRRDEGGVHALDEIVGDPIPLLLGEQDLAR